MAYQPYTAIAVFDPSDAKGAFADFLDAVPEGMSRRRLYVQPQDG